MLGGQVPDQTGSIVMSSIIALLQRVRGSRMAGFAVAYAATAALQKAIGFLLFLWVAHVLGVAEYAVFGLLFALQSAITTFATAGIVESAIGLLREFPPGHQRERLFAATNSAFLVLAAVSTLFAAVVGIAFMGEAREIWALAGVVVAGLAAAYVMIQASLVRLEERHSSALALGFCVPTAAFIGGAVGLAIEGSVSGFYVGSALASLVALVPFVYSRVGHHVFLREADGVRRVLLIVAPFMLIALLAWLGGYGNTYLVELFFDIRHVAGFVFVYTVSAIMQLVATALNQVWSPRFYQLVHAESAVDVEHRTRNFTVAQGLALGGTGAVLLVVYTPALDFAGGNLLAYRDLRMELFLLCLAYAVSIPWWHAQNYFYAHGRGNELVKVTILSAVTGLAAWVTCALVFGVLGAYLGFLAQMLARAGFALAWARRRWNIRIAWEGPLLAAIGLTAGLLVASWLFGKTAG